MELKFTSRGPRLIEVNCRMGGGPVRDTNLRVWGIDLVEEHLLTSLRIPTKPLASPVPLANLAEYSLNAKKSGRMQHTNFMQVCQITANQERLQEEVLSPSWPNSHLISACQAERQH